MDLAKAIIIFLVVLVVIIVGYKVVMWKWGKVDKYELQQNSKNAFLNLWDRLMGLFSHNDDNE